MSDNEGTASIRLPLINGQPLDGLATIENQNKLNDFPVKEFKVTVRRLDDISVGEVGFIKVDVEGHELSVLRGGLRLLKECRPNLLIEAEERHR